MNKLERKHASRQLFTLQEAARDVLGISPDILRAAYARGEIRCYSKPSQYGASNRKYVLLDDLIGWVREFWCDEVDYR